MKTLKNMMYVCLSLTLMIAGCGKKKEEKKNNNLFSQAEKAQTGTIPVYAAENEHLEPLFAEEDFEEFAFLDEDENFIEQDGELVALGEADDLDALGLLGEDDHLVDADYSDEYAFNTEVIEEEVNIECDTVHFDFNKDKVKEEDKALLEKNCKIAKKAIEQGKVITVQGHCDQFGPASYNLALSQKRAEAVKDEMVKAGVDAEKIITLGFGQEAPLVWSDSEDKATKIAQLAPNRRAEILATS